MIKKELIINEKIDEIADNETDSQEVVLEVAYKKRLHLKKLFESSSQEEDIFLGICGNQLVFSGKNFN